VGLANEILAKLPGRRTRGRTHVLAALIECRSALTHTEVELLLPPELSLDRVTLYRILDWLTEHRVVHRVTGADRAVRYAFTERWASSDETVAATHAHYQCDKCGRVGCLDDVDAAGMAVPQGFEVRQVDILVRGICEKCDGKGASTSGAR
jgi:Fur family ferric uptake transcriptional regulator